MRRNIIAACVFLLFILLTGCGTNREKYSISIADGKEYIEEIPKQGKAGETVTVQTCAVMDATLVITVNGENPGVWSEENVYTFEMPHQDVSVSCKLKYAGESYDQ